MNIVEEPHYNNPDQWKNPCHGIELFNDFTYNVSYNSELSKTAHDSSEFVIPCYNGKKFHMHLNLDIVYLDFNIFDSILSVFVYVLDIILYI